MEAGYMAQMKTATDEATIARMEKQMAEKQRDVLYATLESERANFDAERVRTDKSIATLEADVAHAQAQHAEAAQSRDKRISELSSSLAAAQRARTEEKAVLESRCSSLQSTNASMRKQFAMLETEIEDATNLALEVGQKEANLLRRELTELTAETQRLLERAAQAEEERDSVQTVADTTAQALQVEREGHSKASSAAQVGEQKCSELMTKLHDLNTIKQRDDARAKEVRVRHRIARPPHCSLILAAACDGPIAALRAY